MHRYSGIIIEGSKKARGLGFPTVNIACGDEALSGIYAGEVEIEQKKYPAAIFADAKRKLLEAHLLGFSGDVYGQEAVFTLFTKLREYEEVTDETALKTLIAGDVEKTRKYFATRDRASVSESLQ